MRRFVGFAIKASALCACLLGTNAHAVTFSVNGGIKYIYLQVGAGTDLSNNATVNTMLLTVTGVVNGNGVPLTFSGTGLPTTGSAPAGNITCNATTQVYVQARQRRPGAGSATLSVSSPASLIGSPLGSIPISQISWTTDGSPGIGPGTFSGGSQTLATLGTSGGIENCLTFSYANSSLAASGRYTAQATYTLVSP